MKRVICILLTCMLSFSLINFAVFAEETAVIASSAEVNSETDNLSENTAITEIKFSASEIEIEKGYSAVLPSPMPCESRNSRQYFIFGKRSHIARARLAS